MAKEIILVTGGARSGKSRYAESRATALGARRLYLATAEAKDEEMVDRIIAHRRRRGSDWITIEEPLELATALLAQRGRADCVLVDCVTIWLSNLLLSRDPARTETKVDELVQTLARLDFHVVLVANEVGWSIVPDNALARQFRDLAGWANQQFAAIASEVVLTVAGLPLSLKRVSCA
jgi:adenosylcobinamide kinase / adenosylcobinamide-phosphate guanylyltransferase